MSIKFLVSGGGGVLWVLGGGGGKCRFYFYGREDFSELSFAYILVTWCACQALGFLASEPLNLHRLVSV